MKFTPTEFKTTPYYPALNFFKLLPEAFAPEFATAHAGCFDLRACLVEGTEITVYHADNTKHHNTVGLNLQDDGKVVRFLNIFSGERVMVPTGLILDIPFGFKVDLYSRSGIALKQGLVLSNGVGKIDSDYVDPTYILLTNTTSSMVTIYHGDRIAQGEMVLDIAYEVLEQLNKPQQKSDRVGGLGSTGVK